MSTESTRGDTTRSSTPSTLPERLARMQFNASLAVMTGDDMTTLDAAATLESAADLLGDGIALARWVAVLGEHAGGQVGHLPPGLLDFAGTIVRRADEATREDPR
jgi:hypothetical protein